jgi:acyl-CoA synthetase (AMP-forming)/AMP-acid ligase II
VSGLSQKGAGGKWITIMCILSEDLEQLLLTAAPAGIQYRTTTDAKSVTTGWCTLADKEQLAPAASVLKATGARLMTITIFQPKAPPAPAVKEGETLTIDEVKQYVRENMARHKVPKYVAFINEFPMTASGKIQKFKLREWAIEEFGLQDAANIETA